MNTGNVSTVAISSLIFDPVLQCRVGIDDEVVDEYSSAMKAGAVFPPIRLVDVGGDMYVVDGWHRARAAESADLVNLEADVTIGTRRDALLMAISANCNHGLRRSADDKRRAVRTLLQDTEWAGLSSRELGALAGVSHAHVGKVRRHYDVARGELLTEERIELVDGELPPSWKTLYERTTFYKEDIRTLRSCADIDQVLEAGGPKLRIPEVLEAVALRVSELTDPADVWPWPTDTTAEAKVERFQLLDDAGDIRAALESAECPPTLVSSLARLHREVARIDQATEWDLESLGSLLQGRAGLSALLETRRAELAKKKAARPQCQWEQAREISNLKDDDAQATALVAASDKVREKIHLSTLGAKGLAAFRYHAGHAAADDCLDPTCRGWMMTTEYRTIPHCSVCNQSAKDCSERIDAAMDRAMELIGAGIPLRLNGITVTRELLEKITEHRAAA